MLIKRTVEDRLRSLAQTFPVVTIEGPRQSGKTTLVTMTFPEYNYVNLEVLKDRNKAKDDPEDFLKWYPPPVIIDEIQRVPELLSAIQVESDRLDKPGMFILTGSHQPKLKEGIAQSLAGRTAIITLMPLSMAELASAGICLEKEEYINKGFLPGVYHFGQPPQDTYGAYYRTYVEKDVNELINLSHRREFETFLALLAGRVGQVVNYQSLAGDVGVSPATIKGWLSILEASFIIVFLPPYYANFGKRLIKSPKIYFTEVGLAASLLDLVTPEQVLRNPLFGGLFENLVVMEAYKARLNALQRPSLYFLREQGGLEVDLLLESSRQLHLFEIKSARTPDKSMAKNMQTFSRQYDRISSMNVIYSGDDWSLPQGVKCLNFKDTAKAISEALGHE